MAHRQVKCSEEDKGVAQGQIDTVNQPRPMLGRGVTRSPAALQIAAMSQPPSFPILKMKVAVPRACMPRHRS